ncbi:hypothetical protein GCM10009430_24400 [Aquimarina litoralis]|uniref:Uncharacterized protein n=1 Tax=Aquimarina litoralis TaxID=584605 RepID=A0ABN1IVS4_9FLAO
MSSCDDTDEETINPSDIIELQILDTDGSNLPDSIISDGETIVVLQAQIPANADEGFRTVTFKKTGGEFIGIDADSGVRTVDSDGIAKIELKVPLNEEILFLSAEIGSDANIFKREVTLNLVPITDIITLRLLNTEGDLVNTGVKADGYSSIFLEASIDERLSSIEQVQFTSSGGVFQGISAEEAIKTLDDTNRVVIELVVPIHVNQLFFKAQVKDQNTFFDEQQIQLERAYADQIIIEPNNVLMALNAENEISVFLRRNLGSVSAGASVDFEAFQVLDGEEKPVGRFTGLSEAISDANGKLKAVFKTDTGDIDETEPIIIRVSTLNDILETFEEEIQININVE